MSSKPCICCGVMKPRDDYYAHSMMADGCLNKCKPCVRAAVTANRQAKADYYRAYDLERAKRPERIAAAGKIFARWRAQNPERRAAQVKLGYAVRSGRVIPWPVCALPECDQKPEAHHPDYSQPLDVVWLCPAHHKQAHAMAR